MSVLMALNDLTPNPCFKVTVYLQVEYITDDVRLLNSKCLVVDHQGLCQKR